MFKIDYLTSNGLQHVVIYEIDNMSFSPK